MVSKEKLDRINALARQAKTTGLSPEEKAEQDVLRKEYIENFRASFKAQLDNIEFVDDVEKHH